MLCSFTMNKTFIRISSKKKTLVRMTSLQDACTGSLKLFVCMKGVLNLNLTCEKSFDFYYTLILLY